MQKYTVSFEVDENAHKQLVEFLKNKTVEAFVEEHLHAVIKAVTDKKAGPVEIIKNSVNKVETSLFRKIIGF